MACSAIGIASDIAFPKGSEIVRIEYELGCLTIYVRTARDDAEAVVSFADVEAFRVMDERDLNEYWPTCSTPNGWLFEVQAGGWLTQELERPGSLIGPLNRGLHEYLITGEDDWVRNRVQRGLESDRTIQRRPC